MKQIIINILKVTIPLGLGIYIFYYFWSKFDPKDIEDFKQVFLNANYFWIAVSMILAFISHWSRAVRWRYALKPLGHHPKVIDSYNAIMIGYIANILVPRMGEASRAAVLNRTNGVSFQHGFGSVVAERVIDMICLLILMALSIAFNYDNIAKIYHVLMVGKENEPSQGFNYLPYLIMGLLLLVFAVLWFKVPKFKDKVSNFIKGLKDGFMSILKMEDSGKYFLHTLIIWTCYLLMFYVCFFACDFTANLPFAAVMIGFVFGTIGFLITQGGIGTYPIMVGAAILYYINPEALLENGISAIKGQSVGFGMLVWLGQTVVIVLLGLVALLWVQITSKKIEKINQH